MTLPLPELYAFRLGSAAEALSAQDEPDALSKFLDELTEKVNTHRPDIMDAFCSAGQLQDSSCLPKWPILFPTMTAPNGKSCGT